MCVLDKHIHLITLRNKKIGMVDDVQYPKNGSFKPIAMWLLCMNNMLIWILMAKPIKSLHIGSLFCIEQCTNDPPVGRSHIRLHTPAPAGKYGLLIMFRLLAWQTGKKKQSSRKITSCSKKYCENWFLKSSIDFIVISIFLKKKQACFPNLLTPCRSRSQSHLINQWFFF